MTTFKESLFEEAADELEKPNVDGWELLVELEDVTVYRKYSEDSGLYSYKVIANLKNICAETCVEVYMDLEYRKKWDSYVKELFVIDGEGNSKDDCPIYWNVNYPFPMSNRDYVYARKLKEIHRGDQVIHVILGESLPGGGVEKVKEKRSTIRVEKYFQFLAIGSNGEGGTKAFIHYYDDPKGTIPTWLINWAAKTGVPGFVTTLKDACVNFPK